MTLKGFDVNIKQEGGRGFKGRNLGHWIMRNNCESLLTQEYGIEWEARTEDGSCTADYAAYSNNLSGLIFLEKIGSLKTEERNVYGCNLVHWWCLGGNDNLDVLEYLWKVDFRLFGEENYNGHTVVHKLAQRRNLKGLVWVLGREPKVEWGEDEGGLWASDLARLEGWGEGERLLKVEEEERGLYNKNDIDS
ncbi:hypothetical protein TrLO_g6962 [Triparma laevis f. longispina]|uniref:Uncharacterized protein n=1 Tax=Triparma laevis f. longispina TaxID=1714387 RepID=A0A9W7ED85_9STRA|nr:hypothetical protein TrLO_g6962 [Triparma laevis f. longispina]